MRVVIIGEWDGVGLLKVMLRILFCVKYIGVFLSVLVEKWFNIVMFLKIIVVVEWRRDLKGVKKWWGF